MNTLNHLGEKEEDFLSTKKDLKYIFLDSDFLNGYCCIQQRNKGTLVHVLKCIPWSVICL